MNKIDIMDFIELIKKECFRRGYSNKTILAYCNCVKRFFNKCHKEPRKVTKRDIREYLEELQNKGKSGNTINIHLNALKFLMREILNKNFMIKIKYSKTPKRLPVVLTKVEVKRLIDSIENKKHKIMIKLMYSAGLRVSELVNLRIMDLEFNRSYGWVRKGKGNKDRLFIIAQSLKEDIKNYIIENSLDENCFLFKGRYGHLHVRTIHNIIKQASKKAKISKNVHAHVLRHSFATHLIENGYDVYSVQSLLGHNSAETTMIYVHMASPRMINVKSPLDNL